MNMIRKIDLTQMNGVAISAFVVCLVAGALLSDAMHRQAPIIVGALLGLYLLFAIKVVRQWEKVALLRLGRYVDLRGPGIFSSIGGRAAGSSRRLSRLRPAFRCRKPPPPGYVCRAQGHNPKIQICG